MVDGAALLATMFAGMLAAGQLERGARRQHPRHRRALVRLLRDRATASSSRSARSSRSSTPSCWSASASIRPTLPKQHDRAGWPALRERFAAAFAGRSRDEWCAAFEGSDACFAPVLSFTESRRHPHVAARAGAIELAGIAQPAPAPRFDRTPGAARRPPPERGEGGAAALRRLGLRRRRDRGSRPARRRLRALTARGSRSAASRRSAVAQRKAHSPSRSAATPSSRSFSRWAVSERIAIGCRRGGTSA